MDIKRIIVFILILVLLTAVVKFLVWNGLWIVTLIIGFGLGWQARRIFGGRF